MAFITGFGIGLATLLLIGPVVFTLLQGTLQYGFRSGFAVALGIIVSDIVAVLLLVAFGAASFFENEQNQLYIGILGTVILLGFGLKYLLKPSYNTEKPLTLSATDFAGFFVKGFLVNFVNPFVFAVWIGIIGYGSGKFGKGEGVAIFLIGVLAGIFSIDLLKALLAHKIKKVLKPQYMVWVYRVSGILLIGFGIRMLIVVI